MSSHVITCLEIEKYEILKCKDTEYKVRQNNQSYKSRMLNQFFRFFFLTFYSNCNDSHA